MIKFIAKISVNFATPKAASKHELLFNKLASGSSNKSSFLVATLGVTKFVHDLAIHFVHFVLLMKPELDV